MSFSLSMFDLAFFVAPAVKVALTEKEQTDLQYLEGMLQRRQAELKLCNGNRNFAARIKNLQADILELQTEIADLKTLARYRKGV